MTSVNALRVTFDIVEYLSRRGDSTVKDISRDLGRPKSTVYDHLDSLQEMNYIVKSETEYRLSSRFLWLGLQARDKFELFSVAKSEIDKLAQDTGEHAALFVKENDYAVMLYTRVGENSFQISQYDGMAILPHCGAAGKVLLAYASDSEVTAILDRHGLPRYTENTITDRDALLAELADVRQRGYAFERGEHLTGLRAIAVPVMTRDDEIVGVVTAYGPASRFQDTYFREELPKQLTQTANVIQINYTY